MMSLAIYDALDLELDVNQYSITGTGTIDKDGIVGEIGESNQKVLSASLHGFKHFFVPAGKQRKRCFCHVKRN